MIGWGSMLHQFVALPSSEIRDQNLSRQAGEQK
jgi:hypothetical protein